MFSQRQRPRVTRRIERMSFDANGVFVNYLECGHVQNVSVDPSGGRSVGCAACTAGEAPVEHVAHLVSNLRFGVAVCCERPLSEVEAMGHRITVFDDLVTCDS